MKKNRIEKKAVKYKKDETNPRTQQHHEQYLYIIYYIRIYIYFNTDSVFSL